MAPVVRAAERAEAGALARFVDIASEGFVPHLWARLAAPGEDALAVGARRIADGEGGYSWRDGVVADMDGVLAGGLVSYRAADAPAPLDDLPPMLRPPQALKNRWALGTQYVVALAVLPEFRRRGVALALMAEAERRAAGARGLSLTVFDGNRAARRLYADLGFEERGSAPLVKDDWASHHEAWVVMVKPLAAGT